jgi:TPR repeat protein
MASAEFSLGLAYATGHEVPKNDRQAAAWYRRLAEQNYAPAQLKLGVAYVLGTGVPRDPVQACIWLSLATEQITAEHDIATEACTKLEAELSAQQIAEARRLVAE